MKKNYVNYEKKKGKIIFSIDIDLSERTIQLIIDMLNKIIKFSKK